jgi:Janus/Ocnus family (Ocnus)
MDVFPKFICEDDFLILSKCTYHKQLVTDSTKVKGGGWFKYDSIDKSFTFFGTSEDFGRAFIETITNCIKLGKVYTNSSQTHDISADYDFYYKNDYDELIPLNFTIIL